MTYYLSKQFSLHPQRYFKLHHEGATVLIILLIWVWGSSDISFYLLSAILYTQTLQTNISIQYLLKFYRSSCGSAEEIAEEKRDT